MADLNLKIQATIEQAESYVGRGTQSVRVHARYESAGTIGNLTMDFPESAARSLYVGREIVVEVHITDEA